MTLGHKIRELRLAKGLSVSVLAKRIGVSAPFLSDLEHNKRSTNKLSQIAKVLDVEQEVLTALDSRIPPEVIDWMRVHPQSIETVKLMMVDEAQALVSKAVSAMTKVNSGSHTSKKRKSK